MDYLALLQALNSCHGPAGDEGEIAEVIRTLAAPYVDEYTIDTMGNLIVHKKGSGPKVMFAAHMDSIGLIVTHIDEKGYLSFGRLGGIHPENLLHTPVRFKKGLRGVVSLRGDTAWKDMTINDLFIDIGAKNEDEARSMVEIGDTAVADFSVCAMGTRLSGPYMDNRISCAAMLEALSLIRTHTSDLYCVFTVQEELGLRGSKPAAFSIDPEYGIAVDVTLADELDAKGKGSSVLGGGAAIKVMDNSVICHKSVVDTLEKLASDQEIPYQLDVITGGGTDAGSIHITRSGVRTGGISIPCRYMHSPVETVETTDVSAAAKLIAAFAEAKL